ncbi:hypothetical protein SAY86_028856 [Trapa natans]|uniref:Uncharacterized protein n=1 Tax=Trapa natans TaxID=22666 RepID=A0AAN7M0C8_TRANT|nr:hypothetical protein SAY86_028856 [Trapa natans]
MALGHLSKPSHNSSNKPAGTGILASEKTRREKFQSLSLVGRATSTSIDGEKPMGTSDASHKDEELGKVVHQKIVKFPRKSLQDCNSAKQASVPRKHRSAMKKRGRESLSPPVPTSKKPMHLTHGGESPQRDVAKKTNKQGRSDSPFSSVPITHDEKEVVETLYSLAGMFLNNNTGCKRCSTDESSPANTSPVPGGTKTSTNFASEEEKAKLFAPSCNEERSSEETMRTRCLDGPTAPPQLNYKLFNNVEDSNAGTDEWITSSHSGSDENNDELHASQDFVLTSESNIDAPLNQPEKIDLLHHQRVECKDAVASVSENGVDLHIKVDDHEYNGPVLWPSLLSSSVSQDESSSMQSLPQNRVPTGKVPWWLNRACSIDGLTIEKSSVNGVYKISRKKCVRHVFICNLIHALKMPEGKDKLQLQPSSGRQHEEAGLGAHSAGLTFNLLRDSPRSSSCQARNAFAPQNKGQEIKSSLSLHDNFSSLSTSVDGFGQRPSAPHVQQQRMSAGLPTSKTYSPHFFPGQLSGTTTSQQLPPYLGNSGRPFLQQGSMVTLKEQQHQQLFLVGPTTSTLLRPSGNLKAVSQFPAWGWSHLQ